MPKVVSAAAIHALKESLNAIYWYKNDLKSFLLNCISDNKVVLLADWQKYKRQIIAEIVDYLCKYQDIYFNDIENLFFEVCKMESFQHLENLEDGKNKIKNAINSINALKKIVNQHNKSTSDTKKSEEMMAREAKKLNKNYAIQQKTEEIRLEYINLISSLMPQKRGYELEKLLYKLFELFDLDPKASFKNIGEQIDGAFSFEGTDYLFEGKWQQNPAAIQDLDAFSGKISRKLDNTLGLFLSINGFTPDGVTAHSTGRPVVILMTGADLMAVLELRIDFSELILRKRRHASQTGRILIQYHEMT